MSLGLFKRVALWFKQKADVALLRRVDLLRQRDVSDPLLPLDIATLWRDATVAVFTDIPMSVQICEVIDRKHENFTGLANTMDKTLTLIVEDDYEHLTRYLSRKLETHYSNPVAEYLTNDKGYPIDTEAVYIRINTMLYSLAAALDGLESFEYHRAVNPLYRELINVITRLLEIKHR